MKKNADINLLIQSTTELLPVFEKVLKLIESNSRDNLQHVMQKGERELNEYINKKIQEALYNQEKNKEIHEEVKRKIAESLSSMLDYFESTEVDSIPIEHFDYIHSQLSNIVALIELCKKHGYEIAMSSDIKKRLSAIMDRFNKTNKPHLQRIYVFLSKLV